MSCAALSAWQSVLDAQCPWLTLECKDESQDPIEPKNGREGEKHRISLRFQSPDAVPHILTPEGWRSFLCNEREIFSAKAVKLAFIKNSFGTKAFNIEPWTNAPTANASQNQKHKNDTGPRRQVRCQSPDLMAPVQIEPWILSGSAPKDCQAITIWQEIAAQMIAKSLPNELYKDGEISKINLSGQPPRRLEFGTFPADKIPFKSLQEAAIWVYLEGDDVEVRHTFLSAELARAWNLDVSFCAGLDSRLADALESARLIYKAHLRSSSKDTLKALADLRKTLADEVQKLLQQSKDLLSTVWRDVAIAIGTMAIRLSMDSVKATGVSIGFAAIYFTVAIYIGASYWIAIRTNNKFLKIIETARQSWRTKLYAFLDDDDYKALADKPLTDAVKVYQNTQAITSAVVIVVILILMAGFAYEAHWIEWHRLTELTKSWWTQLSELVEKV